MNIIVNTESYKDYENMNIILRRKINKVWFISYFGLLNASTRIFIFLFFLLFSERILLNSFVCERSWWYFCTFVRIWFMRARMAACCWLLNKLNALYTNLNLFSFDADKLTAMTVNIFLMVVKSNIFMLIDRTS